MRPRLGDRLPFEAKREEEVLDIIDGTIEWYAANGSAGERFGETIERVGLGRLIDAARGNP